MSKQIAVFCGSAKGKTGVYEAAALALADAFIKHDIGLVYGGGSVGLMGVMADRMMEEGGKVTGIITKKLYAWEVGHDGITTLEVVDSMHQRKARMANLSDAFIAMPGGIGTLDELMEIYTWRQLGYHDKPIALLNVDGYFDALIQLLSEMVERGFLQAETRNDLLVSSESVECVERTLSLVK